VQPSSIARRYLTRGSEPANASRLLTSSISDAPRLELERTRCASASITGSHAPSTNTALMAGESGAGRRRAREGLRHLLHRAAPMASKAASDTALASATASATSLCPPLRLAS
jgi:hypothetical protein